MAIPLVDVKQQNAAVRDEMLRAIEQVIDSGAFVLGPALSEFEQAAAAFCGCEHAVGVSSGTDALLVSLMALGIGAGDEVIVPTFTFFATAGGVWRTGARPRFVDIDPETFNIDPASAEAAMTDRTRAIVPVHLFGQCADMQALTEIARRHHLRLVEDAAQALGAKDHDRHAGTIGDMGCLSFYPSKTLGACGEGGMCLTNDAELAQRLRQLRHHGQSGTYEHAMVGGNFRLESLQAAALNVKLKTMRQAIEQRRAAACRYAELLADLPVEPQVVREGQYHGYNYYTIRAPKRDALREHLTGRGIAAPVFYPLPLHLQPCFAELGHREGDFPVAEQACREVLTLPMYPELTEAQQREIANAIGEFYHG